MKKLLFVFILLLILPFTGCKSVVQNTVVEPVEVVEKKKEGVLYGRLVNGEWGWYEDGDVKKDLKYVGQIENGGPNGHGTLTSPDGDKYVGEFKNGYRNSQGSYTWSDGDKYVGEWKNGTFHGQGTRTWSHGMGKYVGGYKNGKRHGQGIMFYSDQEEGGNYVGEWKYGDRWNGIRYDKNGNIEYKIVYGEY